MKLIGFLILFPYVGRTTLYQSFVFPRADMWW